MSMPKAAILMTLAVATSAMAAPQPAPVSRVAQATKSMRHIDGYFPLDWDAKSGKLYLEIGRWNSDFLYLDQLPYGIGLSDIGLIGLDRGQLGRSRVVRFERQGPKVLLVALNLRFRSSAAEPDERLAVTQSFPQSVLWGFKIEAEDGDGEQARVLVDATAFFLRDAQGVTERLAEGRQGTYRLDESRSAIVLEDTKNFPKNTEVETLLTLAAEGTPRGSQLADVTPDPRAVTVRERHSFVELPGPGYTPRAFDPRAGFFEARWRDYSASLDAPMEQRFIVRHRLQKKDPAATIGEPVQPIIYYVDRGAPEPIRTALLEGARWWSRAFEAAGFRDSFRVEVLPEGADPMDIRYNTIQWVHRSSRGWSYGASIVDPRTGEIIKGQVTLGSLRARQDYLIAEALLSPYAQGRPVSPQMREMVLARIRQLAAHEVGHTLGLQHNFAASAMGPGTSVMDYPHPFVTLDAQGRPDLSHAYTVGIGAWDETAIAYGYSQFPSGTREPTALSKILSDSQAKGLYFITDEDSRPLGSAHPYAHLWDNGSDPARELARVLQIRSAALARFGENAIAPEAPFATLEDTLVPLFLLHRYQTEAAAKMIGGLDYRYALRGDGEMVTQIVSGADQRRALDAVLSTLDAKALTLPEPLLRLLPPRPPGFARTRESFPVQTGLTFDPVAAAESSADMTLALLLNPERAARLEEYHARDASNPSLRDVLKALLAKTWEAPEPVGLVGAVQRAVDMRTLEALLALAADPRGSAAVKAEAAGMVTRLARALAADTAGSREMRSVRAAAVARIGQFEQHPADFKPAAPVEAPPGMPIGEDCGD